MGGRVTQNGTKEESSINLQLEFYMTSVPKYSQFFLPLSVSFDGRFLSSAG